MALGVLNNLSAIYAENNLNNTSSSLQTVLEQLSSGSRINSGADDAAGLSLVNGLAANSAALTQSATNATEGVGLLQVADGALSQVTSLLNRAITLATEASNGTLNTSQDSAANQEYQSLMAEINNIGSTTTYNQEQVFAGSTVAIYTGDSSKAGSSIDELHIRTVTSSSVGDTNGAMSYSTGSNNSFIDLSNGGTLAGVSDQLAAGGVTSIDVTYMTSGAGGALTPQTQVISVGTGYSQPNTVQGLINAINGAGLGLTATFTTASQAGTAAAAGGKGADTGIEISGLGSGVAGAANGAATPGVNGTIGATGTLTFTGGTMTINGKSITLGNSVGPNKTDTVADLEATINAGNYGVYIDPATGNVESMTQAIISTNGVTGTGTYTAGTYYTVGVTEVAAGATSLTDTATGLTAGTPASDTDGTGGTATISYSDAAGVSLSGTDLLNQTDAQAALTVLNEAITDVASMDGYIGAQINTLNSISQVMSTQQENVLSAQNAIQATDYASATSNMSKYEILSQTGIAALAQANSVQQEVTKLLQ
jgi:flagellin